jgi:hypothetical protein
MESLIHPRLGPFDADAGEWQVRVAIRARAIERVWME